MSQDRDEFGYVGYFKKSKRDGINLSTADITEGSAHEQGDREVQKGEDRDINISFAGITGADPEEVEKSGSRVQPGMGVSERDSIDNGSDDPRVGMSSMPAGDYDPADVAEREKRKQAARVGEVVADAISKEVAEAVAEGVEDGLSAPRREESDGEGETVAKMNKQTEKVEGLINDALEKHRKSVAVEVSKAYLEAGGDLNDTLDEVLAFTRKNAA
jgi:hypothetical protein